MEFVSRDKALSNSNPRYWPEGATGQRICLGIDREKVRATLPDHAADEQLDDDYPPDFSMARWPCLESGRPFLLDVPSGENKVPFCVVTIPYFFNSGKEDWEALYKVQELLCDIDGIETQCVSYIESFISTPKKTVLRKDQKPSPIVYKAQWEGEAERLIEYLQRSPWAASYFMGPPDPEID